MSSIGDPKIFTPYSTIVNLTEEDTLEYWVPDEDKDRIFAYQKYEEIYWGHSEAFKLAQRGDEDDQPIYVPNAMTIVDTTSHFFMKGVELRTQEGSDLQKAMEDFNKREMFLSKFHVAKHSGVIRGDFLFHITADPQKPAGKRVSVNSVDPACYFPETDPDDLDRILAINLVEVLPHPTRPGEKSLRVLRYDYGNTEDGEGSRRVFSQEAIFEPREWNGESGRTPVKLTQIRPRTPLPDRISTIPIYHFKNKEFQGWNFGSSELKGFETLLQAVAQGATDEQMALSLEGLGVYATSSGPPTDSEGKERDWIIAPGYVMELGSPTDIFKRVEGISSVKPFQEHFQFLVTSMYEASATFQAGSIDATIAQSGIALAIRFLPTAAKLEQRDESGVGKLQQMWFDWQSWMFAYENQTFSGEVEIVLGSKLPEDKNDILNTLNNMVDRKTIPKKWYREEVAKLYSFVLPDDIDTMLKDEAEQAFQQALKAAQLTAGGPGGGNQSNNLNHNNESGGTEATQTPAQQTKPERTKA